jgi:hypothetical protein
MERIVLVNWNGGAFMFSFRRANVAVTLGAAAVLTVLSVPVVSAQGVYAYPLKGQSAKQQERDRFTCHEWAVGQTGFNPNTARVETGPVYSAPPPSSGGGGLFGRGEYGQGGGVADAGKGAAVGALGGAIAGDAGKGAAIGALSGLFIGGVKRSNRNYEQEQWERQQAEAAAQQRAQAEARYNQGLQAYQRAFSACMSARDYRVR